MRILIVNAGSQSVKLGVVGDSDQLLAARTLGPPDESTPGQLGDFLEQVGEVDVAGHRVVHGGPLFTSPVVVDSVQRASLEALSELAPLHNPPALSAIDTFFRLRPRTPSVVCFDTAFHAHLPAEAAAYALPSEWVARWGIRRFGFHGLSCAWAASQAERLLNRPIERLRLVICHLGGGASVTAVSSGRSVDTSMGFTPLEGLVMATRPGDVDPGAVLWALRHGLRVGEFGFLIPPPGGILLGVDPDRVYQEESKLLRPGTTLLFYTDGLIEVRGRNLDGMAELLALVESCDDLAPQALCDQVLDWRRHVGRIDDDVCIMAARLT